MNNKNILRCLFLLFLTAISCEKFEENPVNGSVFLTLDLRNRDKILQGIPSYKTYLYSRPGVDYNPQQNERIGLGGLLVVHTPIGEYYAFDLACPNEQTPNRNTIVEVDKDGMKAVCPKCGTKYDIWDGPGTVISSEGRKHGLKSYRITVTGYSGIVTN
jgi:nitrite reductase/ring-hydroxylating ferredoxin subunit